MCELNFILRSYVITDLIRESGTAIASISLCYSVCLFALCFLNQVTFLLELLHVYGS